MTEIQTPGVQRGPGKPSESILLLARQTLPPGFSVDRISDQGMAQLLEVDPNLMGSAGLQIQLQQCDSGHRGQSVKSGNRRTSIGPNCHHLAMDRVAPDRSLDESRSLIRCSVDNAQVSLLDPPFGEGS